MKLPKGYMREVLRRAERTTAEFPGGSVTMLTVYHDDDCPKLKGGECNCEPEYSQRTVPVKPKEGQA